MAACHESCAMDTDLHFPDAAGHVQFVAARALAPSSKRLNRTARQIIPGEYENSGADSIRAAVREIALTDGDRPTDRQLTGWRRSTRKVKSLRLI
jgi:hypothetical protein